MMAAQLGPRFRALGTEGAYVKWGLDVQEDALRAGASPGDPGFGEEPREAWGALGADDDPAPVETEPGRYVDFYARMEEAIRAATGSGTPPAPGPPGGGAPGPAAPGPVAPPVPLEAGVETLRIIEAARRSSEERTVVSL
jgi:predicted dehydrogenase